MADAILYGITLEVLKNLGSRALNEIASTWGFKDRLEKLKRTVNTIKNVLLDAEEKQAAADGHAARGWLEELATVVYAADDLFDEFNTIASRKQLLHGNNMTKEVHTFFSTSNQIAFAGKLSRKIKSIREKLEAIRKDGADFGLAQRAHLQQRSTLTGGRDQSYSYVDAEEVIGRDDDKKNILALLLASVSTDREQEPEVLPIVGIGGMGKTTLAQLIYNDSQVQNHFELRLWVCVAEDFDIKLITEKILRSITHTEAPKLDMEQLQSKLRSCISGKKYLLVLDDVWEENPNNWGELRALLKIGRKGSKIIVTTRSQKVADVMGTYPSHQLKGLSENQSWALFEKLAFKSGEAQQKPQLVKVGKEILKKCANVPLAIKTLGGILRFEDEDMWMSFKDKNLTEVMDVLKLSYQHLQSPWKNCFAYCALFPKDHLFDKELLIDLWMAVGFIIPCENGDQSLEDVAEGYFINLLQRGLFQDVKRDEWRDMTHFKMHDLVHDLAQEEAKGKCVTKLSETDFGETTLHLSITDQLPFSWKIPDEMLNLKLLRTYLYIGTVVSPFVNKSTLQQLVTKFCHLRVLVLPRFKFKSLPKSIGKLIHLRYLNLSESKIETLPSSIINLYKLQTLNLRECSELKTLPMNIEKLVNLRSLNITNCHNLTHMPSGIGKLTLLRKLTMFIVGHKQFVELKKKPTSTAKLSDLKKLNNLIGKLEIRIHNSSSNNIPEAIEAGINNKHGLTEFTVAFDSEMATEPNKMNHDEAVLEVLKPNCNLRKLSFYEYAGDKVPSWARMDNLAQDFPKVVHITLWKCKNCQQLPSFSQLPSLKKLHLKEMESVVYMESDVIYDSPSSKSHGSDNLFFPSLEILNLWILTQSCSLKQTTPIILAIY